MGAMNEKTKTYLGWAIIIAVLIVAGGVWSMAKTYSKSQEPGTYRSFAVSGEGKAVGVPDVAEFTFSVINEGTKDITTLEAANTAKVNKAIDFLKARNIKSEDIKTEVYSLEPRYQSTLCRPLPYGSNEPTVCPPPTIVGYTVRQTVLVKVRKDDFAALGELLSGVIESGANTVSQLNFTVDDPVKLENEARTEAVAKAMAKAEALADAGDFNLGRLLSVEEGGVTPFYGKSARAFDESFLATASVPAPVIEPGSQEVSVFLTLRYEIK